MYGSLFWGVASQIVKKIQWGATLHRCIFFEFRLRVYDEIKQLVLEFGFEGTDATIIGDVVDPSSARSSVDHAGRIGESVNNLAEAHCEELNRPVRPPTPGGVGGASE